MQLINMFTHPLKSARGIELTRAFAGYRGLLHDREWLLVRSTGEFMTARSFPQILHLTINLIPGGVIFSYPGRSPICAIPGQYDRPVRTCVWKDTFIAYHGEDRLDHWMSEALGQDCQLLWIGQKPNRTLPSHTYGLSFADGFPYLLINQASLAQLNSLLAQPVSERHFRPNLVISGTDAYQEDQWKRIRIGAVEFEISQPCTRCVLITIDPESTRKSKDGEPLKTLSQTRKTQQGVCFGVNMVALNQGIIQRGDTLEILETR
jgi:uncharacterized protein YcbX